MNAAIPLLNVHWRQTTFRMVWNQSTRSLHFKSINDFQGFLDVFSHKAASIRIDLVRHKRKCKSSPTYVTCNMGDLEGKKILGMDDNLTNRIILRGQLGNVEAYANTDKPGKRNIDTTKTSEVDLVPSRYANAGKE